MNVDISLTFFLLPSLQMAVIPPPAPLAASSLLLHLFKKGLGLGAYLGGIAAPPIYLLLGGLPPAPVRAYWIAAADSRSFYTWLADSLARLAQAASAHTHERPHG